MAADLPTAGSAKDHYDHNYTATSNVDAWVTLTNPANWSAEKAAQFKKYFTGIKYEGA